MMRVMDSEFPLHVIIRTKKKVCAIFTIAWVNWRADRSPWAGAQDVFPFSLEEYYNPSLQHSRTNTTVSQLPWWISQIVMCFIFKDIFPSLGHWEVMLRPAAVVWARFPTCGGLGQLSLSAWALKLSVALPVYSPYQMSPINPPFEISPEVTVPSSPFLLT